MIHKDTLCLISEAKAGSREAAEQLIEENSGLVWSIVRRFFGRGIEADDLYQLGCMGFLKAIEGFDESFGTQFSTYAVPKISGEIRRFIRDDGSVKVSRGIKERSAAIKSERSRLEQQLGREPLISELAESLKMSAEDVVFAETAAGPVESLQRESGDENFTLEAVLGDYGQEDRLVESITLNEAIRELSEKEQKVIALRFFHGLTQDKTAQIIGVSQVQISRLERRAIENLRELLTG